MKKEFLSKLKNTTIEALYIYLNGDTAGADTIDMIDEIARLTYNSSEDLALQGIAKYLDDVLFFQDYPDSAPIDLRYCFRNWRWRIFLKLSEQFRFYTV